MFRIRARQMERFAKEAARAFEGAMVAHVVEHFPVHAWLLGRRASGPWCGRPSGGRATAGSTTSGASAST